MMEMQSAKRLADVPAFYRYLEAFVANLGDMRRASSSGRVSKMFRQRIMLAVTQVNGCRYCSYYHARIALEIGMSSKAVESLLDGKFGDAPQDELVALMYAQHYAESEGHPEAMATKQLFETYGEAESRDILAYICMIMVGNTYGNAFDAFQGRLRGRPFVGSTLGREIGVLLGIVLFIPLIAIRRLLSNDKPDPNF